MSPWSRRRDRPPTGPRSPSDQLDGAPHPAPLARVDREPFARLNADPEVMRYFLRPLSARGERRLRRPHRGPLRRARLRPLGRGARAKTAPSWASPGWPTRRSRPRSRPVSRSAGDWRSSPGETATPPKPHARRCVSASRSRDSRRSSRSRPPPTRRRCGSWSGSGCIAIRPTTSTIRTYRWAIHFDATFSTGSDARSSTHDARTPERQGRCGESPAAAVDRLAGELDGVDRREVGKSVEYRRSSVLFATQREGWLEFRLRPEIAAAALRTRPTRQPRHAGRSGCRWRRAAGDSFTLDRATAWFEIAWRLAGEIDRRPDDPH